MKKVWIPILAVCICVTLLVSAGCRIRKEPEKGMIEHLENWVTKLGRSQLTEEKDLTGEKILQNDMDDYTGSYNSKPVELDGREVLFGGSTLEKRTILCYGIIKTVSGEAKIRVRRNEDVSYITLDEDGAFTEELSFESGGNYIMIDYEDFTGEVELVCTEREVLYEE